MIFECAVNAGCVTHLIRVEVESIIAGETNELGSACSTASGTIIAGPCCIVWKSAVQTIFIAVMVLS